MTAHTDVRDMLRCPSCSVPLEGGACSLCGKEPAREGGVWRMTDAPADTPTSSQSAERKELWTPFRKASFAFMEREVARLEAPLVALDLGAGPGQFSEAYRSIGKVIGVDFAPYPGVEVVADLSRGLPFIDACAPLVLATNVIEHMADPAHFLREARRVLAPGGALLGVIPFMLDVHQRPYDFQRFTDIGLEAQLRLAGFARIHIEPLGSSLDLLATVEQHYFQHLFTDVRRRRNLMALSAVKVLWGVRSRLARRLLRAVDRSGASADFTLGYGFSAIRPH